MDSDTVQWSNLPKDLLAMIAERLDTLTDLLRLCAVCSPWRSSLTPFPMNSPPLSIKLPFPITPKNPYHPNRHGYLTITENTIFYLEPGHKNPYASTFSSKGWMVKVGEGKSGKTCLFEPLGKIIIDLWPESLPKVLNLLNFRVFEVNKVYNLQFFDLDENPASCFNYLGSLNVEKVVMSSSPVNTDGTHDYAIMALHGEGQLGYLKLGDNKWSSIIDGRQYSQYNDIAYHKGNFYAVDYKGRVVEIDSSLKVRKIESPIRGRAFQRGAQFKHLVESFGDLFLFVRADQICYYGVPEDYDFDESGPEYPVHFMVYKLSDERKEWIPAKSLGDRALFVGDDCSFSVLALDFPGCKQNCIYFTGYFDKTDGHPGSSTGIFDLEDGNVGLLSYDLSFAGYSQIFWPPPPWLWPKPSSSRPMGVIE